MVSNSSSTRKRSNGAMDFGIAFVLPDPTDLTSLRSRIVLPKPVDRESVDEDGEENGEVEESFDVRVLRFRKKELEDELREIEKLEKARNGQDEDDEKHPLKRSPPKRKPRPDDDDEDGDSDTDASEETEEEDSEDSEDSEQDSDSDDEDEDDDDDERRKIFQCIQRNEIPRGRGTRRHG